MSSKDTAMPPRRVWRTMALTILMGGTIAAALMLFAVPTYQAQTDLYVAPARVGFNKGAESASRAASYADLLDSDRILGAVAQEADDPAAELQRLRDSVEVEYAPGSSLIRLRTTGSTAVAAQEVATALSAELRAAVIEIEGVPEAVLGQQLIELGDPVAVAMSMTRDRILGTLLGMVLGGLVGLALLRTKERHDAEIRSAPELRRQGHVVLADLSKDPERGVAELLEALPFTNAAHPLRALHLVGVESAPTAAHAGAQLAVQAASQGHRVLLVDASLDAPSVWRSLGQTEPTVGLCDVLLGQKALDDVLWTSGNLAVLGGGQVVPNPGQILAGSRWNDFLINACVRFELVVVVHGVDAQGWGDDRNQVALVARPERDDVPELVEAQDRIRNSGGTLAGVILARDARLLPPVELPVPAAAEAELLAASDEADAREVGLF